MTIEGEVRAVPGEGELVLLVEDEPALRQLAVLMLERLGYRVVETADGGEALAAVREKGVRPDVVLTDVVIPGMSGPVLIEHLRETLPDVKVIYMSGYTDDAIAKRGVVESGVNFLQKPFTMSALGTMINTALGK
jgi:two-component system, cell cycle sensor histidine kinase and response regulator CckA